jgi:hypothetical protein
MGAVRLTFFFCQTQVAIAGIHFVTGFGMYVSSTLMSSLGNNTKVISLRRYVTLCISCVIPVALGGCQYFAT